MVTKKISINEHGEETLRCPFCGFDYIAITKIIVAPYTDGRGIEITKDKAEEFNATLDPHQRGVLIVTSWSCEEGHSWNEHSLFHEGQISRWIEKTEGNSDDVIWRD